MSSNTSGNLRAARLARLGRSRLLHFFVLGGALWLVLPADQDDRRIVISAAELRASEAIKKTVLRVRELSPAQRGEVLDQLVEDELLYREALRLGLDRSDHVVRRRLVQKLLFVAQDLAGVSRAPDEPTLKAHYRAHRGRWRQDGRVGLQQLFFRSAPGARAAAVKRRLDRAGEGPIPTLGDSLPLPARIVPTSVERLGALFGPGFVAAVRQLPLGRWEGPVRSKYGWHLVRVTEREPARILPFAEVRQQVAQHYRIEQREQARRRLLDRLAERYDVEIERKVDSAGEGVAAVAGADQSSRRRSRL